MRILQFSPRIPAPPNDGGAVYLFHIAKELANRGHELTIAALASNKHEQSPNQIREFAELVSVPGHFKPYSISAAIRSLLTGVPVTVQHRMAPGILKALVDTIEGTYDVILVEGIHISVALPLLRTRFPDNPIVLRQSNVEHEILASAAEEQKDLAGRLFYRKQADLMKRFELTELPKYDAVSVISERDKSIFASYLPQLNYYVCNAGAHLPEITENRTTWHLITYAHWEWHPNLRGLEWFLNRVWPKLAKTYPKLRFSIYGKGMPERIKKTYDQSTQISFEGFVEDIESVRQRGSVMVAPLFSGSGMKLKVLEAFASGLPTVTTQVGVQGIAAEDGKDVLLAKDEASFLRQISLLLENPEQAKRIGSHARELVRQKYRWSTIGKHFSHYLQHLVDRS